MKVELIEHEGCFEIALTAETLADGAQLVRFGSGRLKEIRSLSVQAYGGGGIGAGIVFGKSKRSVGEVKP